MVVEVMKSCYGHHFLSEKRAIAERFRLEIWWCDYGAAGQAVVLTVMELLDFKWSVSISHRRAEQSLKGTLFGVTPVWYRAGERWSDQRNVDSRWTSAGRTKEEKHENDRKWNKTRLQTFKKPRLSSWVGLSWNSLSAFIPRFLLTVWGIYGGTKTEPEQRIKGSSCSFIQTRKYTYFIRSSAALVTKKILKIATSALVFKLNSRSHKPHLFTFWYFKDKFNTLAGLLHIWHIRFVKAAFSGFLFLCIPAGWMESAEFLRRHVTTGEPQGFVLDPLLLKSYISDLPPLRDPALKHQLCIPST